jgi:hypothetical protein
VRPGIDGTKHYCPSCLSHTTFSTRYCYENGTLPDEVPEELRGLTEAEESLISLAYVVVRIYRKRDNTRAISGHVITVPQDVATFTNRLPRAASNAGMVLIRSKNNPGEFRQLKVRRASVLRALQWLIANNDLYRHVQIDRAALDALPEEGQLDIPVHDPGAANAAHADGPGHVPHRSYCWWSSGHGNI